MAIWVLHVTAIVTSLLAASQCLIVPSKDGRSQIATVKQLAGRSPSLTPTLGNANTAFNALQQWYNASIGCYFPSIEWWNSANSA